ncbi:hypothetical protein ACI5KX_09380 [Erythrobacter sp. GH1-10]|uniref:hypothetical protein n=1 Tax=Erythrobacter sp. GH1-10 TaxID=3349334 RepID=UPI003877A706
MQQFLNRFLRTESGRTRAILDIGAGLLQLTGAERGEQCVAEFRDKNYSTVLLGRFNPLIFSPEWLRDNKVIGPEEAQNALEDGGIEIMAPNVVSMKIGSMKLLVEDKRFMLLVGDEPLIRAKDFPASCFSLLRHTPVSAVGLNYNVSLIGDEEDKWNRFGDILAPKDHWGSFMTSDSGERMGGLRSITLDRQKTNTDGLSYRRLILEIPESSKERLAILKINNHFDLSKDGVLSDGDAALEIINNHWDEMMERSNELAQQVKDLADNA